jgi:hypothetical protein
VWRRFIKNNLMVEVTSSARLARVLGWLLRRHTMLSFSLYCTGRQIHHFDLCLISPSVTCVVFYCFSCLEHGGGTVCAGHLKRHSRSGFVIGFAGGHYLLGRGRDLLEGRRAQGGLLGGYA